ncbi:hypothetical protein N9D31_04070, partial [Oligoflexaceae bacterium]|nr:hypothetical protein [Oligoflexaceae bacterium]
RLNCVTPSFVRGFDKNNKPLIANKNTGRVFGDTTVKIFCRKDDISINLYAYIKKKGETSFKNISEVAISCENSCANPNPAWGDPQTFPPVAVRKSPQWLRAAVRNRFYECEKVYIPNDKSILRSVASSTSTKRGKTKPFISGPIHIPTVTKICELFGYNTYVSSTCEENSIPPYDDQRCNYTSPGDNYLLKWSGSSFVGIKPAYHQSWLSTITCKDKK